jgi:hypothetical protein
MSFSLGGSDYTATSSQYPSDAGQWVHWAFTLQEGTLAMSIFRNAVQQGVQSMGNGGTASTLLAIGSAAELHWGVDKWDEQGFTGPFKGRMDEQRLYLGVALSALQLETEMTSLNSLAAGLVVSITYEVSANLLLDSACSSSGPATSAGSVTAATGKLCGTVSAAGSACPE